MQFIAIMQFIGIIYIHLTHFGLYNKRESYLYHFQPRPVKSVQVLLFLSSNLCQSWISFVLRWWVYRLEQFGLLHYIVEQSYFWSYLDMAHFMRVEGNKRKQNKTNQNKTTFFFKRLKFYNYLLLLMNLILTDREETRCGCDLFVKQQ